MEKTFLNEDLINGKEGKLTAIIGERVYDLGEVISINAEYSYNKDTTATLGSRGDINRIVGTSGTGSMSFKYNSSKWAEIGIEFKKTGRFPIVEFTSVIEDRGSRRGRQVMKITGILPDKATIFKHDVGATSLEDDFNFTFEDAFLLTAFSDPTQN